MWNGETRPRGHSTCNRFGHPFVSIMPSRKGGRIYCVSLIKRIQKSQNNLRRRDKQLAFREEHNLNGDLLTFQCSWFSEDSVLFKSEGTHGNRQPNLTFMFIRVAGV